MSEERQPGKLKRTRLEVYWTTVSYRTLGVYAALVLGVVLATLYLIFPDWFGAAFQRIAAKLESQTGADTVPLVSQARFINLDGKVEVRKADSTRWVAADFRVTLERGDLVQTGSDGVARIVFADGTTYTVKPATLITVEENSLAQDRTTRVAVSITTGAVDLTTGTWEQPGSKSQVTFEDATASMRQNSRAAVRTDPTKKQHEITMVAGGADLTRGSQRISLGQWDRVSFPTGGPETRTKVLAPPELTEPLNLQPIVVAEPRRASVKLAWKPVAGAAGYQVRVSRTSMFTQLVADRRVTQEQAQVSGLDPGDYFWAVTAVDAEGKTSEPSDIHKFTLAMQGRGQEMHLEVEGTQLHGNVVEVFGRTEPGAAILINGQPVANIGRDGRFRHFTERLERGSQDLTIIGQNRRGGYAKREVTIVVP